MANFTPDSFCKTLADPTRARIALLVTREKELCVCELTCALDEIQPKISRHLALLRESGLLADRRQGQWVYYSVNPDLPNWAVEVLKTIGNQDESLVNQSSSKFSSISTYCE